MSELTPGRPDLAVATLLAGAVPSRCRVSVDLSRMENSSRRAVEFDDCDYIPRIGETVDAVDLADQREADAEVVGIDERARIVRIAIDWMTVRQVSA